MKRLYFMVIVFVVTLVFVFSVDNLFFGLLHPFGCDYKGLHLKKSDNGKSVSFLSKYTYEKLYEFVAKNAEYTVRVDGMTQFYVSKNLGSVGVGMLVSKHPSGSVTYNMSLLGTKSQAKSNSSQGVDCNIANYIITRNVNDFIVGLHFPKDLEGELLKSFYVSPIVSYKGLLL